MSSSKPVTLLTAAPASRLQRLRARLAGRRSAAPDSRVRGPDAVRQSLVHGLKSLGVDVRLDPPAERVSGTVGVLSGIDALQWAIRARRTKRIEKLLAGPNLVVVPDDAGGLIRDPAIDTVVTPVGWVSDLYRFDAPELDGRLREWSAGVDTDFWAPGSDPRSGWLLYDKASAGGHAELVAETGRVARAAGISLQVIRYGDYDREAYRDALRRSEAMIVISESESQGLAQFEAWSCDVPTLVWDRRRWEWQRGTERRTWPDASASPFLTRQCGIAFRDLDELPSRLGEFRAALGSYGTRQWILDGHTLRHAAQRYLDLVDGR